MTSLTKNEINKHETNSDFKLDEKRCMAMRTSDIKKERWSMTHNKKRR